MMREAIDGLGNMITTWEEAFEKEDVELTVSRDIAKGWTSVNQA